jgi:hypothetical protein
VLPSQRARSPPDPPSTLPPADRRPSPPPQAALPLPSVLRSPSIEGYRNKAEFTIGLDANERPSVGFLLGSFKVGRGGGGSGASSRGRTGHAHARPGPPLPAAFLL